MFLSRVQPLFLALSVFGLAASFVAPLAAGETITVENNYFREIGDKTAYLSGTFTRGERVPAFFNNPEIRERMTRALKENGIRSFRFHNPDQSFWRDDYAEVDAALRARKGQPPRANPQTVSDTEFISWLDENGFKAAFQINNLYWYDAENKKAYRLDEHPEHIEKAARYQAELVKWTYDNGYADAILYWELGNETYGAKLRPKEAAAIDSAFIKAIRAAAPQAKIAVNGQSPQHPRRIACKDWSGTVGQWHKEFLTELVGLGHGDNDIDFLSQHAYAHWIDDTGFDYPAQQPPSPDAAWRLFKRPAVTQIGSVEANRDLLKSLELRKTRIHVNEFKRGASRLWHARTLMHALAQTDPLFYFIRNPLVEGAVIHCLFNNGHLPLEPELWKKKSYGWSIFVTTPQGEFLPTPITRLYRMLDRFLADGDRVLRVTGGGPNAIAAHGGGRLKLMFVNKEDDGREYTLKLSGLVAADGSVAKRTVLTADRLDRFPVDPFSGERHDFPLAENEFPVSGDEFAVSLPRWSVTLFEIDNVAMPEAKKIPFAHHEPPAPESEAKDFYDTASQVPAPTGRAVMRLDFTRDYPALAESKVADIPDAKIALRGLDADDFGQDGVRMDGESHIRVAAPGRLPRDTIEITALFKAEPGQQNAMVAAIDHHYTGIGLWNGKFYADIKTDKGRYRYQDGATYPPGKWLLMTVRYDGREAHTYVNGALMDKAPLSGKIAATPLYVGSDAAPEPRHPFRGQIRHLSVSAPAHAAPETK